MTHTAESPGPRLEDLDDATLLAKLLERYERPAPASCSVCSGPLTVQHRGGGLPLTWACAAAAAERSNHLADTAREPELTEHLTRSIYLDYRAMGDARVMELVRRYLALRASVEVNQRAPTEGTCLAA